MATLITLMKYALVSAENRGINVYIPPDGLAGHLYEFGIPDSDNQMFIVAINKDGSGSFTNSGTIKYRDLVLTSGTFDSDGTNELVVNIIGYLAQLEPV